MGTVCGDTGWDDALTTLLLVMLLYGGYPCFIWLVRDAWEMVWKGSMVDDTALQCPKRASSVFYWMTFVRRLALCCHMDDILSIDDINPMGS